MNGKGDKYRVKWSKKYEENYNKIFGEKMSEVPAKMYLDMWLSEQIPIKDWLEILKEKKDVRELYNKHLEIKNV